MLLKTSTASLGASHSDEDDDDAVVVMLHVEAVSSARKHQHFVGDSHLTGERSHR